MRPGAAGPDAARPPAASRRPQLLALVMLGGTLGTTIRAALESAAPAAGAALPWTTLVINVTGSFLLGLLLEILACTGPDTGGRRMARLTLGTGLLGGYTTYSTLALETTERLVPAGAPGAVAYAIGSVVLGVAAAAVGVLGGRRLCGHRLGRGGPLARGVPR